jgi:hypothetical protein
MNRRAATFPRTYAAKDVAAFNQHLASRACANPTSSSTQRLLANMPLVSKNAGVLDSFDQECLTEV